MNEGKARRVDYSPDEYIAGVAGQLSAAEQGIYWLICSLIMSEGGPIQYNDRRIGGLCQLRPSSARKIVDRLIDMGKILLTDDGKLTQKRAESEVKKSLNRIETAQKNGQKGGRTQQKDKQNQQNAEAEGSFSEKLTTNHQPPTEEEGTDVPRQNGVSKNDLDQAVLFYSDMAKRTGLPVPRELTDKRRRRLRKTLETHSMDDWRQAVAAIEASSFCRGESGDRQWRASLDFLLQPDSFIGLIEGKYADKGKSAAAQPDPNLVTLAQDHPDFLAVKRKRRAEEGRDVIVSATGKATISRAEVEQARKWVQDHDQGIQSQELAHAGSHH